MAVALVCGLVTAGSFQTAVADTSPAAGTPPTVSGDGLPTWQINGVVWAQVLVGNTVYATGEFTKARPPGVPPGGAGERNALNIFAFDVRTGAPVTFNHSLNAQGRAIAATPDGSRVIVGGDFTAVDGVAHGHLAAFNTATGALVNSFDPSVGSTVRGVDATNDTVYAGGNFFSANGQTRRRLASFDLGTGNLKSWAPTADDAQVDSLVLTPDSTGVVVGGRFSTMNGQSANSMGAVDATTGALRPWLINQKIRNAGTASSILHLNADDTHVYGTGFAFGTGNFEGAFRADPDDGAMSWMEDCHGDTYGVQPIGEVTYIAGHPHNCSWIGSFPQFDPRDWRRAMAFTTEPRDVNIGPDDFGWNHNGSPAPEVLNWFPNLQLGSYTGQSQGPWSVTGNDEYVVMGGEFPTVNGVAQQGLVRFTVRSKAPNLRGPTLATGAPAPTVVALPDGRLRVSWQAATDIDNEWLTYRVTRSDGAQVIHTETQRSTFWMLPKFAFADDNADPGESYSYTIRAYDPDGNMRLVGTTGAVTAGPAAPATSYNNAVVNDGALAYWRLGETSGSRVNDYAGGHDASVTTTVTRGTAGAIVGDPDRATTFTGTSNGNVATDARMTATRELTLEAWIRTTTTTGGKILGYGSSRTGASASFDRHLYMRNNGTISFGVFQMGGWVVSSPTPYNNGAWHHVVATVDRESGISLYVDGQRVAHNPKVLNPKLYSGFWRVGGDNLTGWGGRPSLDYFTGAIDEVAIYRDALPASVIQDHNTLGRGGTINQAPIADFSWLRSGLEVEFDGSASSDPDGTIASYSWNFGDGSPAGSGPSPSHEYAAEGTYNVTLTVTDNGGRSTSKTVPVEVVNQAPVAVFTPTTSELSVSVNGAGSSDPDGSIVSYAWDFGDGATGSGVMANHTYAATGTYQVTLTVTDDLGRTGSVTTPVTVSMTGAEVVTDHFTRTVAGGWGTADSGQLWSGTGSASQFAVASGTGRMTMTGPGNGPSMRIGGISDLGTDTQVSVGLDQVPTGSGVFVSVLARDRSAGSYRAVANLRANGSVSLALTRIVNGTTTTLQAGVVVPGLTVAAGERLDVRFWATPSGGSTLLRAKVWRHGTAEPGSWLVQATDANATLASAGGSGLMSYLAGNAAPGALVASFDDLTVSTAQ
ncbi:PKD domain-containing protein [Nocardioides speluncae]|uniref:PKD domain-containing protein n=1 Tax=Nocardioides speluncae TaxID=2670337 RepID=UPI000D689EF4|nr:PKD domain-containing protein [Nocardioides speluncae]